MKPDLGIKMTYLLTLDGAGLRIIMKALAGTITRKDDIEAAKELLEDLTASRYSKIKSHFAAIHTPEEEEKS